MKILVFGVTGCFGTEFEAACGRRGVAVVGLSHADVDVTDYAAVRARITAEKPDVVVNSVALVGINLCEQQVDLANAMHIGAAHAMAAACSQVGAVLVQTSTHAVFDGTSEVPYVEGDLADPGNVYGITKLAAEMIVRKQCERHYVVRFPTMFGARRNKALGFVDKSLAKLLAGEDLRIASDKMDTLGYARDIADVVLSIIEDRMPYGIYHLANSGSCSYHTFITTLKQLVGSSSTIHAALDQDFPSLAPKPLRTWMVSRRLAPLRPWQEALADYVSGLNLENMRK